MIINWTALDFEQCPSRLVFACPIGALRVTTDGDVTINGKAGVFAYSPGGGMEINIVNGQTLITEQEIPLSALSVAELQEIVEWAGVDTEAGTKSGLK